MRILFYIIEESNYFVAWLKKKNIYTLSTSLTYPNLLQDSVNKKIFYIDFIYSSSNNNNMINNSYTVVIVKNNLKL